MDLDDIPVLRHLGLFVNVFKAVAMLVCLFLFPLMALVKMLDMLQARSPAARWYFALQTTGWACAALGYSLLMLAALGNCFGYPAISEGRCWPFLLALFNDASGTDLVLGEILLQSALSVVAFCLSWLVGEQLDNGVFIPRPWLGGE